MDRIFAVTPAQTTISLGPVASTKAVFAAASTFHKVGRDGDVISVATEICWPAGNRLKRYIRTD
tara:strand:- start:49 stop:240 length:192 start_codon:yes stop_codon:yes gene_type:complete